MTKWRATLLAMFVGAVLAALLLPWSDWKSELRNYVAWEVQAGTPDQPDVMIPMTDGVALATDVYLPDETGKRPAVLMRLPYDKRGYGEVRFWVDKLTQAGFAVVAQDMRGRFASEGVFAPYPHAAQDGVDTLDWIIAQPWSNGRVGTLGCSALGEAQLMLAARRHPAHRAMVPIAAGGAIGSLDGNYGYFSGFEGGIVALALSAGWFGGQGGKTPDTSAPFAIEPARVLDHLPLIDVVAQMRPDPTDYEDFLRNFENDSYWRNAGYVTGEEKFATPALFIDTWHDPGVRATLELARAIAQQGVQSQTIIAAGTHCGYLGSDGPTTVGDMPVNPQSSFGFVARIIEFFDHHLADGPAPGLAPINYYLQVEDSWHRAAEWPPADAQARQLFLTADGGLAADPVAATTAARQFISDPANPVPSIGGALCCTGDPASRAGPVFQNGSDDRADVLMYTSSPRDAPMAIAGPIRARISVSADVPDTDLVLRLADVDPDGNALLLQEGALRLRYRNSVAQPELLVPGTVYDVTVEMRDIAHLVRPGHRLRLYIAGSSFPRLARNLNTGGNNYDETGMQSAEITIHSDAAHPSAVMFYVLEE